MSHEDTKFHKLIFFVISCLRGFELLLAQQRAEHDEHQAADHQPHRANPGAGKHHVGRHRAWVLVRQRARHSPLNRNRGRHGCHQQERAQSEQDAGQRAVASDTQHQGLLVGVVFAQNPPTQSPVFKSKVEVVQLDVSVLDKQRQPVRGLTQADFTILEDGQSQKVTAFSAVDVPVKPPPPTAKWMREVSIDIQTNEPEQNPEGRLFVLILDDGLIPADPGAIANAKRIGRAIVDRLTPSSRAIEATLCPGRLRRPRA